jgi:rhodanese-related sulfurtransferase
MGSSVSTQKINFEDIQYAQKQGPRYIIINTLHSNEQSCLIQGSINSNEEESTINNLLSNNKSVNIIVYGKNSNDETIYNKVNQLIGLGFFNIYLYVGGIFEWMLLQDIYGKELFPTFGNEQDILKFSPKKMLNVKSLSYS